MELETTDDKDATKTVKHNVCTKQNVHESTIESSIDSIMIFVTLKKYKN